MVRKRKSSSRKAIRRTRTRSTSKARTRGRGKTTRTPRYVYYFGDGHADGSGKMKPLLGGKGANLHEMTRIGLPVPPGFTLTTEVCSYFYDHNRTYPPQLEAKVAAALAKVEKSAGKKLGDKERPLLVSVRSGARDSMPGMMDTILNLGMNDEVVEILAKKTNNARFAWDSYRRFLQMYGDVVMGVQKRPGEDHEPFEAVIEHLKDERYGKHDFPDVRLTVADLKELVQRFKALIKERTRKSFPQDPQAQLWGAIGAVFGSWMNDRAIVYRRKYGIPREWGTAVNVQTMVFGNMGETSATGVAFTRDPATGEKVFYGEYLINAQGEDVVAGVRTPHPIADLAKEMPAAHKELMKVRAILEKHFKDMQDLEFTVEENRLYILQTRNGKRTGHAAVRIAVDMVEEKLITKKEAVRRIPADSLAHLLAPIFDRQSASSAKKIGTGLGRTGRGLRACRLQRGRSRGTFRKRRKSGPRADRNFARRLARHDCGGGHSHFARRRFIACRFGGASNGQGVRVRCERYSNRLPKAHAQRERNNVEAGRLHLDRWQRGRSFCRRSDDGAVGDCSSTG